MRRPAAGGAPHAVRRSLWLLGPLALFALQLSPLWLSTPDTVHYLSIARHLAAGAGITDLDRAAPAFPPGYPLLIAAPFALSERPFLAISLVHLGLVAVFALATWAWARRRLGGAAFPVTAFVLVNASLWHHYRRPLSELAFMAVLMLAVAMLEALRAAPARGRKERLGAAAALLLLALLPLVREVGVVLAFGLAALSAADARSGRLPPATPPRLVVALVLAAVLSTGAFLAYDVAAARSGSGPAATHVASLVDPPVPHARWTAKALRFRVGEVGRLVLPGGLHARPLRRWRSPAALAWVPVALLVAFGWWRLLRRRDLLAATAPLYVAVYLAWGFEAGTRYMLPLLPLIAGALWLALERLGRVRAWLFGALVAVHLVVSLWDWRDRDVPLARSCAAEWPSAERIAGALPPGASLSVANEVPECVWSMVAFLLDRAVSRDAGPWPAAGGTDWRLVPRATAPPPGAEVGAQVGSYRLLRAASR